MEMIWKDRDRGIVVIRRDRVSSEVEALLEQAEWGTESLRYRRPDLARASDLVEEVGGQVIELRLEGELAGTQTVAPTRISVGDQQVQGFIRSRLTVAPPYRGHGLGTILAQVFRDHYAAPQTVTYSAVEEDNTRSRQLMVGRGDRELGRLSALPLLRIAPAEAADIGPAADDELDRLRSELWELYRDHGLVDIDRSLLPSRYMVARRSGEIVAGVQVLTRRHALTRVGSHTLDRLLKAAGHLPLVGRMLDPIDLRYLWFSHHLWRRGGVDDLLALMTTLMARHRVIAGAQLIHRRDPLYAHLTDRRAPPAALGGLLPEVEVVLLGEVGQQLPELRHELERRPLFASPLAQL